MKQYEYPKTFQNSKLKSMSTQTLSTNTIVNQGTTNQTGTNLYSQVDYSPQTSSQIITINQDSQENPIKLNQIRDVVGKVQKSLTVLKSRVSHLQKQQTLGKNRIQSAKRDISTLVSRKTRAFVDSQYKLYLNQLRSEEHFMYSQQCRASRQNKYDNFSRVKDTNYFKQIQSQNRNKINKINFQNEKKMAQQEIYEKNLKLHDQIREAAINRMENKYRENQYSRIKAQINYNSKIENEKQNLIELMNQYQLYENLEQDLLIQVKATQKIQQQQNEQKILIEKSPVENLIKSQQRPFRIMTANSGIFLKNDFLQPLQE